MPGMLPSEDSLREIEKFFDELGSGILGLPTSGSSSVVSGNGSAEAGLMDLIIEVRKEIRKQKMWALSDKIRDAIKALGIVLEDTKDGTTWKKA
jgi:cysteinyl-tRNA synthetase